MEADWSVALAEDDPVIRVPWAASDEEGGYRFVDLRRGRALVEEIVEAQGSAALRNALLLLNSTGSPFWTVKCDRWISSDEPPDPYEMDAEPEDTAFIAGSYIDLVAHDLAFRTSFPRQEEWLRRVTGQLRTVAAKASRVEIVLRHAQVDGCSGFAASWFAEGCGPSAAIAEQRWSSTLALSLAVIMESPQAGERYNELTGE